jgi:DNA-binding IclR family transcriptional regulator
MYCGVTFSVRDGQVKMLVDTREKQLPRIQSIGRGFSVLFAIARSEQGLQAKEIIRDLGLDRQVVYHILQSLSVIGVVNKAANNRFVLGLRVSELIDNFTRHLAPPERLAPLVRALAQQTGETSYAVGWLQGEIIALSAERGTKPVSAADISQGYANHAHARASGKLLLALARPAEADAYLASHELRALTPNTITARAALEAQFETIRRTRVGVEREEFAPGLCCLAVPIGQSARYVLAMSVPAERFETNLGWYISAMQRIATLTHDV